VFLFKAKTSPEKFLTDCVVNELCLIKELETARGKLYNMNVVEFLDRIIKDERCHLNEVEGKLNSIIGKRG
jgi:hypothetical protein